MNSKYTSAWTALVTPFDAKFNVDWNQLERNVLFQVEEGITGVLPMGSTGESATVTHEEHSRAILKTVEYVKGGCKVIAGTGSNSTEEAIYETDKAVAAGVDCVLLVDCYYNKPSSMELRREYYGVIAEAFPDLDMIPYAIPGRSVTVIEPEDLAILQDRYRNIVGVKEATGDLERMRKTRSLVKDSFNILSGDDPMTFRMMTDPKIRSSGVISVISNVTPRAIEEYTRHILEGKVEKAQEIDEALSPLWGVIGVKTREKVALPGGRTTEVEYKFPNPVPVKTMMNGLGMQESPCKRPLGKLTRNGVEMVRNALKAVWDKYPEALEPIEGYYDVDIAERLEDEGVWGKLSY